MTDAAIAYELAQVNIARLNAPLNFPELNDRAALMIAPMCRSPTDALSAPGPITDGALRRVATRRCADAALAHTRRRQLPSKGLTGLLTGSLISG